MQKRIAYWATEAMGTSNGYHVARVTESEAGYIRMGSFATVAEAKAYAARRNAQAGYSEDEVMDIVASSMRMKY